MEAQGLGARAHVPESGRSGGAEDGAAESVHRQRARRGRHAERVHERQRELATARSGEPDRSRAQPGSELSYRRSAKTELLIQTQDGDTVLLRIKTRDSLAVRTELAQGAQETSEFDLRARSSTRISFSVEGELDEGELAAIRRVIDQAGALAEDFFSGDLPAAFAAAERLEFDPAELARVGLRMGVREQLTYTQRGAAAIPALAPVPSAPEPVAGPAATGSVDSSASGPAPAAPVAEEPVSPLAAIADFLRRLRESLVPGALPAAGGDPSNPRVEGTLKLKIFHAVLLTVSSSRAAGEGEATPLPGIVSQTLDAVDAHLRPPTHEVA